MRFGASEGGMLMFVLILDVLASLGMAASIPVLTLMDDLRLGLCLLGTGIAVQILLRRYFRFDFASAKSGEPVQTCDSERKDIVPGREKRAEPGPGAERSAKCACRTFGADRRKLLKRC